MALYNTPPGGRIPYDRTGYALFATNGTSVVQATQAEMQAVNDEADNTAWIPSISFPSGGYVGLLCPEDLNFRGFFTRLAGSGITTGGSAQYTTTSTDGMNGTWNNYTAWTNGSVAPAWRTNPTSADGIAQRGLRFPFTGNVASLSVHALHLYADVSGIVEENDFNGTYVDRVRLFGIGGGEGGTSIDWGDTPRGTSVVKAYQLVNLSNTKTANNVAISAEALTDTTPSLTNQFSFSLSSSGPFTPTLTVTSQAPNSASNIFIRCSVPLNQPLGPYAARFRAVPGSFT